MLARVADTELRQAFVVDAPARLDAAARRVAYGVAHQVDIALISSGLAPDTERALSPTARCGAACLMPGSATPLHHMLQQLPCHPFARPRCRAAFQPRQVSIVHQRLHAARLLAHEAQILLALLFAELRSHGFTAEHRQRRDPCDTLPGQPHRLGQLHG